MLRGQTASGIAVLGEGIQVPTEIDCHDQPVSVYVRPHDLDLAHERNGKPSWPGRVIRITPLGAVVRLDIELSEGSTVRVELTGSAYAAIEPQVGDPIFVAPRNLKVFLDQEQPA